MKEKPIKRTKPKFDGSEYTSRLFGQLSSCGVKVIARYYWNKKNRGDEKENVVVGNMITVSRFKTRMKIASRSPNCAAWEWQLHEVLILGSPATVVNQTHRTVNKEYVFHKSVESHLRDFPRPLPLFVPVQLQLWIICEAFVNLRNIPIVENDLWTS